MSHPGNDEIIDNERDNPEIKMDDIRAALIQKMVFAATEVGIAVVQEIAEEASAWNKSWGFLWRRKTVVPREVCKCCCQAI